MKTKAPEIIFCSKKSKEIYDNLRKEEPFKGKDLKEIFIMAVVIGFKEGHRVKLGKGERDPSGLLRTAYLDENIKAIIKIIAFAEKGNVNIWLDEKEMYNMTEEYANSGIFLLRDKVFRKDPGTYIKKLETELLSQLKKIKK